MAKEVFIPKLGQTMEEARLVKWLVADGALVEEGQGILEVETDKAVFTVEANARGHVHQGPYKEGAVVPVLTVVATIGKADEKFANGELQMAKPPASSDDMACTSMAPLGTPAPIAEREGKVFASPRARKLAAAKNVDLSQVAPTGEGGTRVVERDVTAFLAHQPKATPVAQKIAAEAGVDLRAVTGTGIGGAITKEDVARTAKPIAAPFPPAEIAERVPLQGVRGIIAERMAMSVHTTARVTLCMEADATEFVNLRARLKARVE
ncbi:MAG: E3 binding domain-containing protein, partial [Chloroflexota bacterium]